MNELNGCIYLCQCLGLGAHNLAGQGLAYPPGRAYIAQCDETGYHTICHASGGCGEWVAVDSAQALQQFPFYLRGDRGHLAADQGILNCVVVTLCDG